MLFPRTEPQSKEGAWPSVPPSLNHQSSKIDDVAGRLAAPDPIPQPHYNPAAVTPYLGLRSRLSQVPMNRWSVLLLLVLVRLLILLAGLNVALSSAKTEALSACSKVEDIGSTVASMPHYLSVGVNNLAAEGITKAVRGMVEILMLILTGVQELIFFYINFEFGTILCLLLNQIQAYLGLIDIAVEDIASGLNTTIKGIGSGLGDAVKDIASFFNDLKTDLDDLPAGIGKGIASKIPSTTAFTSAVSALDSVSIPQPTGIIEDIEAINKSLNFQSVENLAYEVIGVPFDMVKKLLNESYGNWTFDQSVFPVAKRESLTFCSENSFLEDFFDALFKVAATAKIVAIVVLVVLAVLAGIAMAWFEIKRFNRALERSQVFVNRDPMDVMYIASRPLTAATGLWLSKKLSRDTRRQMLIRWVIAYATTYTALFVLSLAIAGFFSCFCQWIIMRAVEKEAPALASQVGDFAGEIVTSLENASTAWANESNNAILTLQNDINGDVLGYVANATDPIIEYIKKFENETQTILNTAFGALPDLERYIQGILGCILFDKLDKIEEGLEWVHNNSQVTLPLFPTDLFAAGANDSISGNSSLTSFLSSPTSVTTDDITEAVDDVVDMLRSSIIQEALVSLALLLVYVAYVFFAVAQAAIRACMPDSARADGDHHVTGGGRDPLTPRSTTPRFPEFGGNVEREMAAETASAARNIHGDPFTDADEKTVYALRDSRDRVGSPTPEKGHYRRSSYGWIEDPGR